MPKTYTKKEIAYNLSCSERTIEEDQKYLNITPQTTSGRPNLYSEQNYQLICQMREHMAIENNTRDTFVPKAIAEVVDEQPKVTKENSTLAKVTDPFHELEIYHSLQQIADKKWSVSTKLMAAVLEITPGYLLDFSQYSCGSFAIVRDNPPNRKLRTYLPPKDLASKAIGLIEPKVILWRVVANNE